MMSFNRWVDRHLRRLENFYAERFEYLTDRIKDLELRLERSKSEQIEALDEKIKMISARLENLDSWMQVGMAQRGMGIPSAGMGETDIDYPESEGTGEEDTSIESLHGYDEIFQMQMPSDGEER